MTDSSIEGGSGLERPMTGDPGADVERDMSDLASTVGPLGQPEDVERPTGDPGVIEDPTP